MSTLLLRDSSAGMLEGSVSSRGNNMKECMSSAETGAEGTLGCRTFKIHKLSHYLQVITNFSNVIVAESQSHLNKVSILTIS